MSFSSSKNVESIDKSGPATSKAETNPQQIFGPTGKRMDYISWHQLHMHLARTTAELCEKDVESADGCYIVDDGHYKLAAARSRACTSTSCNHAISLALQKMENRQIRGENATIYVKNYPKCSECVARILKANVVKIWYWSGDLDAESSENYTEIREKCENYVPNRRIDF